MIRFLYGAGSIRARERMIGHIRADLDADMKAILLVPEQETVNTERRMLELLPPGAQLSFEVLNFSRLANRVFRTLGGLSYRAASPAVSALFMWRALAEVAPLLRQYGTAAAKDSALCELMLKTEAQCKAACISPTALLEAADTLTQGEPLKEKLSDIGLILSTFEASLGQRFENAADDLNRLADRLSHRGRTLFSDTHIYIDSFSDFTVQELAVLRALFSHAPSVTVSFAMNSHRTDKGLHLHAVLQTHRKLFSMAKELGQSVYYENEGDDRPTSALDYLSCHLFDMEAEKAPLSMAEEGTVSLCVCTSPFEEATAIAARIHQLVRAGCRYRDIAVVVRDATAWNGILDAAFEKENIPCFIAEKTDITLLPLVKLITEAFRIRLGNWRMEDVVGYLKTGLCGIDSNDVNLFEEYLNVWHLKGKIAFVGGPFTKNPDGYKAQLSERGNRILEGANRVRETFVPPLLAFFSAMDNAETTTELCAALYEFLDILDIRERLKAQAKSEILSGERRQAEELSRLYNVTVDALEAISDAIGTQKLSVSEFADALKLVFSRTDIGTIPTSADEVTIGSASMLRTDHPRFVLVAGLNDGSFPATVKDDGLLVEADRQRLRSMGVDFPFDNEKMASDELFYLHRAFSAAREGLFLYYSTGGTDGRALSPSIAIARVKALFPTLKPTVFAAEDPLNRIFTPAGAMEALAELPPREAELLLRILEQQSVPAAKSLRLPVVDTDAAVDRALADRLFGKGSFNPTHLESFSLCRFKYYCRNILHLREELSGAMTAADTGTFIHYVLEQVLLTVRREQLPFSAYDAVRQDAMVTEICQRYRQDILEAGGELPPRTNALLERLTSLSRLIVSGMLAELSDSLFTPAFLELNLSAIGETPTVKTKEGESIPLTGQIDRVDYWQDEDGAVYLRITDYKTGSKSFELDDIEKGFCLQMPLYLLALCRGRHDELCRRMQLPADTPFLPACITYLSSNISTENTDCKKDADAAWQDAAKRLVREGLILSDTHVQQALTVSGDKAILGGGRDKSKTALSGEGFEQLFDTLERTITRIAAAMRSGSAEIKANLQGKSSPCNHCSYLAVCRAAKKSNA